MRSFLTRLSAATGFSLPDRSLPAAVVRWTARLVEGLWRLLGIQRTPPLTWFSAAMLSRSVTVRIDKAKAELGYAPVISVEEGMRTASVAE